MTANEAPGLSITEWVVLGLLAEGPAHGFALARELSRDTPLGQVWTVPRALVYRAIGRLQDQGLIVEAGQEPGDPGPTRMVYEATPMGNRSVASWRSEPVRHLRDVRTAFLAKAVLRRRAGEPLAPLVAEQREEFAPLFERLAEQFNSADAEPVVASWRYESSRAVARLLDSLERLDHAASSQTRS